MATDPQQLLVGLIGTTGLGQQIADQQQTQYLRQQLGQQAVQQGQIELDDHAKAAQAAQQFNADVLAYNQAPTPEKLSALAMRYPQQAQNFTAAAKLKDDAQRNADLGFYGGVYAAAKNGRKDLVLSQLQQRRKAVAAAGGDTAGLDDTIQQLQTDPEGGIKAAQSTALAQIYSHDPTGFSKAFGLDDKPEGNHVIGAGGALVDPTGKVLFQAGTAPEYRTIKNADGSESIVQVGGGGQASTANGGAGGSGAPGGRYTGGWTPRQRNGGDNSDAAVDNKIAGSAKQLGLTPDAPFPASMSNLDIAKAMAFGEGGKGSLADRQNNPTNLRDAKTGAYRQFGSSDAALKAAAAQVGRNRARGQNTVRSMIEGLPVGGHPPLSGEGNAPGRVVFTSKPADASPTDEATVNFYAQKVATGGDLPQLGSGKESAAWRRAILARAATIQSGQGMTGADSNLRQADVRSARIALPQLQKTRTNVEGFEQTFRANAQQALQLAPQGVGGSVPIFNRWIQAGRKNVSGDPAVSRFNVAINTAANEYAKLASGASGGAVTSDSARHEAMEILNNAQTLPQLQAAIKQMGIDGHNRIVALNQQEARLRSTIAGRSVGALGSGGVAQGTGVPAGFRVLRVRAK